VSTFRGELHADTRLFDVLIGTKPLRLAYLLRGTSVRGGAEWEHIVPRKRLRRDCNDLFNQGKAVEDVADYLERNLKTVKIHKDERKRLDGIKGLKDDMPDGWKDGDDILVRLIKAEIEISWDSI
jgi:hypothetical protein